jgi:hypothetical protein
MIGVFVWKPGKTPDGKSIFGHAAMWIRGGGKQAYVSFWPGKSTGFLAWDGSKLVDSYDMDRSVYGRDPWAIIVPDDEAGKPGLNIPLMLQKWNQIKNGNQNYTTKNQCSRVVLKILVAGGSSNFLSQQDGLLDDMQDWWAKNVIYAWSPDDVKDYVKRVVSGIAHARKKQVRR